MGERFLNHYILREAIESDRMKLVRRLGWLSLSLKGKEQKRQRK